MDSAFQAIPVTRIGTSDAGLSTRTAGIIDPPGSGVARLINVEVTPCPLNIKDLVIDNVPLQAKVPDGIMTVSPLAAEFTVFWTSDNFPVGEFQVAANAELHSRAKRKKDTGRII